jgi:hypothetical protein
MTGREKEDIGNFLKQKDMEDSRQRVQEQEFEAQQEMMSEREQKQIRDEANERGMLDSGIEKRQSQEARQYRDTMEINPQKSTFAYQQALRDDQRRLGLMQSDRNLADLTTSARRGAQDSQYSYDYGTQKADLSLSQRLAELERERKSQYRGGLALQTEETMRDPVV